MDWWELTNTGPNAVDLTGYSWDDSHQRVGHNVFGAFTIDVNSSIVLVQSGLVTEIDDWCREWDLDSPQRVYGWGTAGPVSGFSPFGSSDGVFLYTPQGQLLSSMTYDQRVTGKSNAWHVDGRELGISESGWFGTKTSGNSTSDLASPGVAYTDRINPLYRSLYWSDKDAAKIQRFNLVTGVVEDLLTASDGVDDPRGIALNLMDGYLYWADAAKGAVERAADAVETALSHGLEAAMNTFNRPPTADEF